MFFRHGVLRFGKLTMDDTDLMIVDANAKDPFDFFLDHYNTQLVAGYSQEHGGSWADRGDAGLEGGGRRGKER